MPFTEQKVHVKFSLKYLRVPNPFTTQPKFCSLALLLYLPCVFTFQGSQFDLNQLYTREFKKHVKPHCFFLHQFPSFAFGMYRFNESAVPVLSKFRYFPVRLVPILKKVAPLSAARCKIISPCIVLRFNALPNEQQQHSNLAKADTESQPHNVQHNT